MILFTAVSANRKTGPIPVSTSSKTTCPSACPLKKSGCYAAAGALNIHWSRLTNGLTGETWKSFLGKVKGLRPGQIWRMNQAGDLQGSNDKINAKRLNELAEANRNKKAICYTHYSPLAEQVGAKKARHNQSAIKSAIKKGFTINLSANNLTHADKLLALGIAPVVSIVPTNQTKNCFTPAGRRVVICPADAERGINCAVCGICTRANREYVVGFRAHGVAHKAVNALATAA